MIHKKKDKYASSSVWKKFHEIYTFDTGVLVKFFFFCTLCKDVVYNSSPGGNTNALLRHVCSIQNDNNVSCTNVTSQSTVKSTLLSICSAIKEKIRSAAASLVIKDLRPYTAIQGQGLIELCQACMEFGQMYRKATLADLLKVLPCPKTVKDRIRKRAEDNIVKISDLIKQAIEFGGLAATTDCWTDDHCHITYISVVLHLCIYANDDIKFYRFILGTAEVPEMNKTGMALLLQILIFNICKIRFCNLKRTMKSFRIF